MTITKLIILITLGMLIIFDMIHNSYEYIINKSSLKTFIILEAFDLFYILIWTRIYLA